MNLHQAFDTSAVHRPGRFRRLCWFTTGVDRTLLCLPTCPESERMRFMAVGGAMLILTGLGSLSGAMAFYQIFYPGTNEFEFIGTPWRFSSSVVFALLWTLALYNMQRFLIFGSRRDSSRASVELRDFLHMVPGLVFSSVIGLTVATPLQVFIFGTEIDTQLVLERQERLGSAFERIAQRFEKDGALPAGSDSTCDTATLLDDVGEGKDSATLRACLQGYDHQIQQIELALLASQGSDALRTNATRHLEAALRMAQIEHDRLQEALIVMQEPGLLKRAALAYEADPLFSWVLLLAVIFVQATPVLISAMSVRGPYDDLVEMAGREKLASEGIEPGVVFLFPELGGALAVDRYHQAKAVEHDVRRQLMERRRRLQEQRLQEFRRRFHAISSKKSTTIV